MASSDPSTPEPSDPSTPGLTLTSFGRPAAQALHAAVDRHKAGDPLAPVTVVVPTNFVGLAMRRLLASGALGPLAGGVGLANVRFQTLYGVASLLGFPALANDDRIPLSTPVLVSVIRATLADQPGMFASVVDHPSTPQALAKAYADLAECDDVVLDRLVSQGPRASEVVRVVREARRRLGRWHDERDLFAAATAEVLAARSGGDRLASEIGPAILHLPAPPTPSGAAFARALASRVPVDLLVGITGDDEVDATALAAAHAFGASVPASLPHRAPAPPSDATTRIVTVPDVDEEVRVAVRELLARVDAGAPLDRMAVLYPTRRPYLLALHEQLEAAGVPFNGPSMQSLGQTVVGRTLLALLALPDHDFRRDDVAALLAAAPLRDTAGRVVNATVWDRLSRRAGVTSGPDRWVRRLADFIDQQESRIAQAEADPDGRESRATALRADARAAAELSTFVADLVAAVDPEQVGPSWAERVDWAEALLRTYLGEVRLRAWPEHEILAAERVEAALDRLAALDAVDDHPSWPTFRHMLETELDTPARRHGRFGEGLLVSPLHLAVGLDLDVVAVLGLAEGTLPGHSRDDVLVPDHERLAATDDRRTLPLHGEQVTEQHRLLRTALDAAPERLLFFARGDARRGRERLPSRWLLDVASSLSNQRVGTESFDDWVRRDPHGLFVESHVDGLRGTADRLPPASVHDLDLRLLDDRARRGLPLDAALLGDDDVLARGLEAIEARRSTAFTRFDGNLAGRTVADLSDRVMSPTSLERWAGCPARWFYGDVLRLAALDRPEDAITISPLDRGSLVHEILEEFIQRAIDEGGVAPDQAWTDADRRRLLDIAERRFDDFERQGVVGKALAWKHERGVLLAELVQTLEIDGERREDGSLEPLRTEMPFGFGDVDPLVVQTPSGRRLRFRGMADRVDRGSDGRLVVIDYKTGSTRSFDSITEEDPVAAGTHLQLPVYGLAAGQVTGSDAPVRAAYWFVSQRGEWDLIGYDLDDEVLRIFGETVDSIADGIEQGVFPARSGEYDSWFNAHDNCGFCEFDDLCRNDRLEAWERKRDDSAMAVYVRLAEPPDDDTDEEVSEDG